MDKTNLITITENFFLCTHLPIRAVTLKGELICLNGYSEDLHRIYNENSIFQAIDKELKKNKDKTFVSISCLNNIKFIASYICSQNTHNGIFILGPYSNHKHTSAETLEYKPDFCIPPIISLLYDLRNSVCSMNKQLSFSNLTYNPYVKNALEYIHENYHKPITLEHLANHLKINKCYFCNILKKETGRTYSEFLNHVRIEKSKELLLDRSLSVLEVSLSIGFNNQNYFNTVFKRLTNMTPMEFRNNLGQ